MSRVNFKELNDKFDLNIQHMLLAPSYKASADKFDEMYEWAQTNCEGKVIMGVVYASFDNADDAFAFKMRWS